MECSWIEPGILAAGSIPIDAKDIRSLHEKGIRSILSLTEQSLLYFREITSDLLNDLEIVYFHMPIPDQFPPTSGQAYSILQIIREMISQQRPIFLHCHAGVGRTGTILHLYYLAQGKSLAEAQIAVRARRIQCILLSEAQSNFLRDFARESDQLP